MKQFSTKITLISLFFFLSALSSASAYNVSSSAYLKKFFLAPKSILPESGVITTESFNIDEALINALLSKTAYGKIPKERQKSIDKINETFFKNDSTSSLRIIRFIDNEKTNTQAIICLDQQGKMYISFRGTKKLKDWKTNLAIRLSKLKKMMPYGKQIIPYGNIKSKIRVHEGFLKAYKSVRDDIHDAVNRYQPKEILFSGHSMGGALAILGTIDIQYNYLAEKADANKKGIIKLLKLFNFGSPRVGNKWFAKSYDKRVTSSSRVVDRNDVVTKVPFKILGYLHVSTEYPFGSKTKLTRFLGTIGNMFSEIFSNFERHEINHYVSHLYVHQSV